MASFSEKSKSDTFSIINWIKAGIGITIGNMAVFLLMSLWTIVFWAIAFGIWSTSKSPSNTVKIVGYVFLGIGAIPFLPFLIQGMVMAVGQMLGQQLFNQFS